MCETSPGESASRRSYRSSLATLLLALTAAVIVVGFLRAMDATLRESLVVEGVALVSFGGLSQPGRSYTPLRRTSNSV